MEIFETNVIPNRNATKILEWKGEQDDEELLGEEEPNEYDKYFQEQQERKNWNVNEVPGESDEGVENYVEYSPEEVEVEYEEEDNISVESDSSKYNAVKHLLDDEQFRKVNVLFCEESCDCEGKPSRFTFPPTPNPSNHTFANLDNLRKHYCKQIYPKNVGLTLTEDLLLDILIKNPYGEFEMLLPGNQIYPGFLKSRITDADIPVIVNVLLEIRGITKVNLCYNEITDVGIQLLAPALQECGNLTNLNLMHNNLTGKGILSLCKALLHRAPLHSLRLTGMKLGQEELSWNALTCLFLSGRTPPDLDVGECDLTCDGWQSLCTALHAMDHDIDYPNYLLLKDNLPMDLVRLKEMKTEYNEEVKYVSELNRKTSQPTFVRVKSDFPSDNPADLTNPGEGGCGDKISLPELFETFSATILQGLFDLRHRFSEEDIPKAVEDDPYYQSVISDAEQVLPSVSQIIENFHRAKDGELSYRNRNPDDSLDQYMSPSLYSLDIVDEDSMNPIAEARGDDDDDEIPEDNLHPPDIYTAEAASTFVVRDVAYKAAKISRKTQYMDRTDITQLLLMTVLETIGSIGKDPQMTQDDCNQILEDAMEKVHSLIFPRMPSDCKISREDITYFFKVIFSVAQGTFVQLFENPFVTQALLENSCGELHKIRKEMEDKKKLSCHQGAMTEEQVRQVAVSFLHGVLVEAAQIIGVQNPFYDNESEGYIGKDLVCTEAKIQGQVESLLESAATVAVGTMDKAHEVENTRQEFTTAADDFVVDLFENVNKLVVQSDMQSKVVEDENSNVHKLLNEFVSRPLRLVLNRPLFPSPHEVTMAAKLGDYLKENTTVRALHIQKWNLAEDGMAALMESAMSNRTLVVLDLANNQLAADGVKLLSLYMTQNKNLKHLILNHNRIKDAGMAFLNKALCNSGLESLDIAYNNITHKELDPLLTQFPSTQLRALYLWGNSFRPDTWNILRTLYEEKMLSPSLTDVVLQNVDGNKMVVKNMQVRDTNEYYEVPANLDRGLRLPPAFLDNSHMVKYKGGGVDLLAA